MSVHFHHTICSSTLKLGQGPKLPVHQEGQVCQNTRLPGQQKKATCNSVQLAQPSLAFAKDSPHSASQAMPSSLALCGACIQAACYKHTWAWVRGGGRAAGEGLMQRRQLQPGPAQAHSGVHHRTVRTVHSPHQWLEHLGRQPLPQPLRAHLLTAVSIAWGRLQEYFYCSGGNLGCFSDRSMVFMSCLHPWVLRVQRNLVQPVSTVPEAPMSSHLTTQQVHR